jgi:transcriptional regulator with XRE-family HTH domain
MHIGEKIKMVRRLRSFTQEELGAKINRTRSAISFIEQTGQVHPVTLDSILKALGISKEDLLNVDHRSLFREPSVSQSDYGSHESDLLKAKIAALTKERDALKALVKSQQKLISMMEKKKNR